MLLRPARPPWLGRPPPPPPGVRARATSGRALPGSGLSARAGPSSLHPPGAGSGGSAGPSPPPFPPILTPGAAAGLLWRLAPRGCHSTRDAAESPGPAEPSAGPGGVLGLGSAPSSALAGAYPSCAAPPPRAAARAPGPACTRGRQAGGRPALGRVRGVRWRWGRREPELSQAPGPPDRAKWGVMAAGGSGCTSSAGGGGGRGVNPRRSGRCVCICVRCVRGREEWRWDRVR